VSVTGYRPETGERDANRRQNLDSDRRDEQQDEGDQSEEDEDGQDEAPGWHPALQVAGSDGDVDERKRQQNERDLDDRSSRAA
jgi:hypothetical protein